MSDEQQAHYNRGFEAASKRQKFNDTEDLFWVRGYVAAGLMVGWKKQEESHG